MKWFKYVIIILILVLIGVYHKKIILTISEALRNEPNIVISEPNEYYKEVDYSYVKINKDFISI